MVSCEHARLIQAWVLSLCGIDSTHYLFCIVCFCHISQAWCRQGYVAAWYLLPPYVVSSEFIDNFGHTTFVVVVVKIIIICPSVVLVQSRSCLLSLCILDVQTLCIIQLLSEQILVVQGVIQSFWMMNDCLHCNTSQLGVCMYYRQQVVSMPKVLYIHVTLTVKLTKPCEIFSYYDKRVLLIALVNPILYYSTVMLTSIVNVSVGKTSNSHTRN